MSKIGLLFGSFNPVHNGHLAIASFGLSEAKCREIWFVLQVSNSFKQQEQLAPLEDRMAMVRLGIGDNPQLKLVVSQSSSMVEGIEKLQLHYPQDQFVLLMGQDLVDSLPQWRDGPKLSAHYQIYGYRRQQGQHANISSELIRSKAAGNEALTELVPGAVADYISAKKLYRG